MHSKWIILAILSVTSYLQQQSTAPATAQDPQKPVVATPAAASPAAPSQAVPTPATSTVYFYRPRLYRGSAARIGIFVDGTMAVNLVNGRWASIQVPSGHHVVRPKDDQSGIEIEMEPGQSYYLRSEWGEAGFFHGAHKNLMLMMKEQATYEIKQLKPLDDKDVTWTAAPVAPAAAANK